MSRRVIMGSLWVVLSGARLAFAQDAPPLEPPATDSPRPTDSAPKPVSVPPAPARSEVRPLLVIPGVTAPTQRGATAPRAKTAEPPGASNPTGRDPAPRPLSRAPVESVPEPSTRSRIPLTLEPIEDEPAVDPKTPTSPPSRGRLVDWPPGVPRADEGPPTASRPDAPSPNADTPPSAPARGFGMFGRFLGPFTSAPSRKDSGNPQAKARVNLDPRPDPTTDAANKKKIEREIRDSLGDRLRSVEVRVSGRNVLIVAKASRFWQKRTVRRALETLPGLAGYRAKVDIID